MFFFVFLEKLNLSTIWMEKPTSLFKPSDFLIQSHLAVSELLAKSAVWELLALSLRRKKTPYPQAASRLSSLSNVLYLVKGGVWLYSLHITWDFYALMLSCCCWYFIFLCKNFQLSPTRMRLCDPCQNCFGLVVLSCCRDLLLSFLSTVREAADSGRYPSIPLTQFSSSMILCQIVRWRKWELERKSLANSCDNSQLFFFF